MAMQQTWAERHLVEIGMWAIGATIICGLLAFGALYEHGQTIECQGELVSLPEIEIIDEYTREVLTSFQAKDMILQIERVDCYKHLGNQAPNPQPIEEEIDWSRCPKGDPRPCKEIIQEQQPVRECVDLEKTTVKSSDEKWVSLFCKYENIDGFAVPVFEESYSEMGENYRQCGNSIDVGFSSRSILVNGSLTYYKVSDFAASNKFYFDCINGVFIKERQDNFFCTNLIQTIHTEYDLDFCNCWSDEPCAEGK